MGEIKLTKTLEDAVRTDQLLAVRHMLAMSMPVAMVLAAAAALVAWHSGRAFDGLVWMAGSLSINLMRFFLCRYPIKGVAQPGDFGRLPPLAPHQHFIVHTVLAVLAGVVWAVLPFLCDGLTSPETMFYLTMMTGITAGAVTHGFAYAPIPLGFILPPAVSTILCLTAVEGSLERYCLAGAVLVYVLALGRSAFVGQSLVRNESRAKNLATDLSNSLDRAKKRITRFAKNMHRQAIEDDLTGLLNRRGFANAVEGMARRTSNTCLILLDLDGFKSINDAFGHEAGDRALIEIGERLSATVPKGALVARLGGDEYAVFYDPVRTRRPPEKLGQQAIAAIKEPLSKPSGGRIGVCIGICNGDGSKLSEMLTRADSALYAAKKEGRNRIRSFDDTLRRDVAIRCDVERDLALALEREELEIWYQPIVGGGGAALNSLEALLRWKHPQHGWISPIELVGVAAASGLSEALMRFVIQQVGRMIPRLQALAPARIAINVSPRELAQLEVDELILSHLKARALSPTAIEVEITEEVAVNTNAVTAKLERLARAGVTIAIDDFGTGYSSLGSIQQLKADRVKIDKSFVSNIARSSSSHALIDAILRVSHTFGFEVVAEGVETEEERNVLVELGCPLMQGYLFAKPMPAEDALLWVKNFTERHGESLSVAPAHDDLQWPKTEGTASRS